MELLYTIQLLREPLGFFCYGVLKGGGSKGEGYLRHLEEPRGALGNTREYSGVLSCLSPLDPPPLRIP